MSAARSSATASRIASRSARSRDCVPTLTFDVLEDDRGDPIDPTIHGRDRGGRLLHAVAEPGKTDECVDHDRLPRSPRPPARLLSHIRRHRGQSGIRL